MDKTVQIIVLIVGMFLAVGTVAMLMSKHAATQSVVQAIGSLITNALGAAIPKQ